MSFISCDIVPFFVTDNYSIAKEKCRKAEYTSDLTSDASGMSPKRKVRKVTKKTFGSSYDEGTLSSSDENMTDMGIGIRLPSPPRLMTSTYAFENLHIHYNHLSNRILHILVDK